MNWTPANLEAHAAKHFLGDLEERWDLLTDRERWAEWRGQALDAGCAFAAHPARCRRGASCGPVQQRAARVYADLVRAEWRFCETYSFTVGTTDERGKPIVGGVGPRGVFVVAAVRADGSLVAKTAFRPSKGPRWVRDAVRKLRALASVGAEGWSLVDLYHLEHALLRPDVTPADPRIAHMMRQLLRPDLDAEPET